MSFVGKRHLIIDIEALGDMADADTIITAVSAIVVGGGCNDPYEALLQKVRFWKLSIQDQEGLSRSTDPSTVDWWERQKEEVKLQCYTPNINEDITARDFLLSLNQYLEERCVDDNTIVWSRGTAYDFPKLLNLYKQLEIVPKFNSWNIADSKTAFLVRSNGTTNQFGLGGNPKGFMKHNALHDTALETYKLLRFFQEVNKGSWVKPKGDPKDQKPDTTIVGDDYAKFCVFVKDYLARNGNQGFTNRIYQEWVGLVGTKDKSVEVRKTLYKMLDEGLISSGKSGVYSFWVGV